jgi:cytoskeletal protein CcmA (bactofilin family)
MSMQASRLLEGFQGEGVIRVSSPLVLAGSFEGNIESSSVVSIDPGGEMKGTLRCMDFTLSGHFSGDIVASRAVHLRVGCRCEGTIVCENLDMEKGAVFSGDLVVGSDDERLRAPRKATQSGDGPASL